MKQAPWVLYHRFSSNVINLGFKTSITDTSMFILRHGRDIRILLLYVNDIIFTGSSPALLFKLISHLSSELSVNDFADLIIYWVFRRYVYNLINNFHLKEIYLYPYHFWNLIITH